MVDVNRLLAWFSRYPPIIEIESSSMANPYYVINSLVRSLKDIKNKRKVKSKDIRNRFIVSFIFWTGIRLRELTSSYRKDLSLINLTYSVPTLKQKRKTKDIVPLNHIPKEELEFWEFYFQKFNIGYEDKLVDVSPRQIERIVKIFFNEYFEENYKSYSKKIKVHSLRHGLGLWLYELTRDIRLVAQVLRHRNIANTLIYTKLSLDEMARKLKNVKIVYET